MKKARGPRRSKAKVGRRKRGFHFSWHRNELSIRVRNFRPDDSIEGYVADFLFALESFLRNEPATRTIPVEAAALASAAHASDSALIDSPTTPGTRTSMRPQGEDAFRAPPTAAPGMAKPLTPLGNVLQDLAKALDTAKPAKK